MRSFAARYASASLLGDEVDEHVQPARDAEDCVGIGGLRHHLPQLVAAGAPERGEQPEPGGILHPGRRVLLALARRVSKNGSQRPSRIAGGLQRRGTARPRGRARRGDRVADAVHCGMCCRLVHALRDRLPPRLVERPVRAQRGGVLGREPQVIGGHSSNLNESRDERYPSPRALTSCAARLRQKACGTAGAVRSRRIASSAHATASSGAPTRCDAHPPVTSRWRALRVLGRFQHAVPPLRRLHGLAAAGALEAAVVHRAARARAASFQVSGPPRLGMDFARHHFFDAPFPSDDLRTPERADRSVEAARPRPAAAHGAGARAARRCRRVRAHRRIYFQRVRADRSASLPDLAGSVAADASVFLVASIRSRPTS